MDVTFSSRSGQELQNFLKFRGVLLTWQRIRDLVRLYQAAHDRGSREEVIGEKLQNSYL